MNDHFKNLIYNFSNCIPQLVPFLLIQFYNCTATLHYQIDLLSAIVEVKNIAACENIKAIFIDLAQYSYIQLNSSVTRWHIFTYLYKYCNEVPNMYKLYYSHRLSF